MRYLKATLIFGTLALLIAMGLFEAGAYRSLNASLASFLGLPIPEGKERGVQYMTMLVLAYGIAWTTIDINRPWLKVAIALAALGELILIAPVASLWGVFFSPFAGATTLLLTVMLGLAYSATPAGRRKRLLHELLGERVSAQTFHALLDGPPPRFDQAAHHATVFVCELFNHDELTVRLPVPEYVAMTNAFLRNAAEFLVQRGAYLDECDGERLRVIFGAPLPDADHARRACETALALCQRLDEVNVECLSTWGCRFDFRMGINTGEMIMASYGGPRLGALSVTGDAVEFARRLCAANTIYGSRILIGAETHALAEMAVDVRPMELIQRHRDLPDREEVYELLSVRGGLSSPEQERSDLFWRGVILFREKRLEEAMEAFLAASRVCGTDEPSLFYLRRIEQMRAGLPALDASASKP